MTVIRLRLAWAAVLLVLAVAALVALRPAPAEAIYNGVPVIWDSNSPLVQVSGQNPGSGWDPNCTATMLDEVWVLTAAHCASDSESLYGCATLFRKPVKGDCYIYWSGGAGTVAMGFRSYPASSLRVRVGPGDERRVAQTLVYPSYTYAVDVDARGWQFLDCLNTCARVRGLTYVSGDVALLRLSSPVHGKARSRLASDSTLLTGGRDVKAYGWGDTDPTSSVNSPSNPFATADGTFRLTSKPRLPDCVSGGSSSEQFAPRNMVLCARPVNNNAGTGPGDSGGPLFTQAPDGNPTQIGVTSYGPAEGYATAANPEKFADVAAMVRWIRSKTGITGDVVNSADNIATALVIDNSGSMSTNDPRALRRDASKSYVNTALDGDYIGLEGFEDSAYTLAQVTALPGGRNTLLAALDSGVRAGGGTNIGAGIQGACDMLDSSLLPARRAAILLTDGDGGYTNQANCFASHNWRIYTVGLGSGVNTTLLRSIATTTGGEYQPVPTAANLTCEFQQLRASIAGAERKPCLSDLIQLGQTIQKSVSIPARIAQTAFSITWPGSDVQLTLESPSGRIIGRDVDAWDVAHTVSGTSETYVVKVPEPGEWKVRLYGAQIAAGGEPVVFSSSTVPFENQLPTAKPTVSSTSGAAPLSVSFDAGAMDPDGVISQVKWDFGDGGAGVGVAAQHVYTLPGTYTPIVTVTDDDGEPQSIPADPIIITGALPTATFTSSATRNRISVDASASRDPGGSITTYRWDFDGDGMLDLETTDPRAGFAFKEAGTYAVTLAVQSADGEAATTTQQVTVDGPGVETNGSVGGTVAPTLALSLGASGSFGPFTPGLGRDYSATVAASLTSTAGSAELSIVDPDDTAPGRLVNGSFALATPLVAVAAQNGAPIAVGAQSQTLLTYTTPVSEDNFTVRFTQSISAAEPLRTGNYSKQLTFVVTTTEP